MERYTLMQAGQTKRVCNTCLQEKVLSQNFYRRYSYMREQCEKDGKWAYVNRCMTCTAKYQADYEAYNKKRKKLGQERLAEYRGYGSYEAFNKAREAVIHTPCPICKTVMSNKGWNEACCVQRRDVPRSYPGFICRKCLNTIRHFKTHQKISDFIAYYDIPMENIPEVGFETTQRKSKGKKKNNEQCKADMVNS